MVTKARIAMLFRADAATADPFEQNPRLRPIFVTIADEGLSPEALPYSEEFADTVRDRLLDFDGVVVWVDPISQGKDRRQLDPLLRLAADRGAWVSAHPDVIAKMGTKEVLFSTQHLGWGTDTHLYETYQQLCDAFPARLQASGTRVLKQQRGNGGTGVWRVERMEEDRVRTILGRRDAIPESTSLKRFLSSFESYFDGGGMVIDQAYQPRIVEGLIRCYFVQNEVVGFARQTHDAASDELAGAEPFGLPSAKTMFPRDEPQFQKLLRSAEGEWLPAMQRHLDIPTPRLPVIWDADFLRGPRETDGTDTYVLCEINASCVLPVPPSAPQKIAATIARRLAAVRP